MFWLRRRIVWACFWGQVYGELAIMYEDRLPDWRDPNRNSGRVLSSAVDMPSGMKYIINIRGTASDPNLSLAVQHKSYHRKSYLQKTIHTLVRSGQRRWSHVKQISLSLIPLLLDESINALFFHIPVCWQCAMRRSILPEQISWQQRLQESEYSGTALCINWTGHSVFCNNFSWKIWLQAFDFPVSNP